MQYQMALDASSSGNFNTMNPEEDVKVIENLTSSSSTKNTDFERKRSAPILGNDQMDEVKLKLDSVHKLLRKQVVRGFLCRIFVSTTERWTRLTIYA